MEFIHKLKIDILLKVYKSELFIWEVTFLNNVQKLKKTTKKQIDKLNEIWEIARRGRPQRYRRHSYEDMYGLGDYLYIHDFDK